jgi:AcrR family transcriptional regulator
MSGVTGPLRLNSLRIKERDQLEKKSIIEKRSRNERLKFYAEIGNYFSPDGKFDENAFRVMLHETLEMINREENDGGSIENLNAWMSSYLEEIIDYLLSKGLTSETFILVRTAIDEAEKYGIKNLTIAAVQMKQLMDKIPEAPKKEDRKKTSSDEMQKRIFDAAVSLFGSRGYHRTTIDEIVILSGVGKGSFYRYFKSKDELLAKLIKGSFKRISYDINRILSDETGILQQIETIIKTWLEFIEANHVVYRIIRLEGINPEISTPQMFFDYIIKHLPMLKERVIALDKQKELRIADFYTVFYGVMGFIEGVAHKWYHNNMSYPLSDELPVILDVLLNGLKAKDIKD